MMQATDTHGTSKRIAWLLWVATLLVSGCAPHPYAPPGSQPETRQAAGYDGRIDDLDAVDMAALEDRRIVLDPGHGGYFRGALGVDGLTESEVNLGVALHLRGLLEARGAQVFLTRTDDRDFLTPADSSLRADLAERTRLANAYEPELFLSIHHNADAAGVHGRNETQTYYKLGDEGPSLDAAQSLHRYLVRNLGIDKHRILPGNYFVLRNSTAPALLSESSYITNPDVERKLALAAKQRLEAEALLLGVAHYFGRRTPRIASFEARAAVGDPADTVFVDIAAPIIVAHIDGPFDRADLTIDGQAVTTSRTGERVVWRSERALPPGRHAASLRVRMSGEGAATARHLEFEVRRGVHALDVQPFPPRAPLDGGWIGVRVRAVDRYGHAVAGAGAVRVESQCDCDRSPGAGIELEDGVGWAYLDVAARSARPASEREAVSIEVSGAGTKGAVKQSIPFAGQADHATGFLLVSPGDTALVDAPGTAEPLAASSWVNRDGFAFVPLGERAGTPQLPGYRPVAKQIEFVLPRDWTAIAGGALHGRRITLDPDGGGGRAAGTGRSGTRAANLNLEIARVLAGMLRAAGAEVRLTRDGDFAVSDVERVQISEAFGADRFLRIGHGAEPPRLGHYYSSSNGRAWAERTAGVLASLGFQAPAPAADPQYVLQQTSCPALYAALARIDDPAAEERLNAPGGLRSEAYALYLALAREWAQDAVWPIDSLNVLDEQGFPLRGAIVTLGGSLLLETDDAGTVRFARTEPGNIHIQVEDGREVQRSVLLDSKRGAVLGGPQAP